MSKYLVSSVMHLTDAQIKEQVDIRIKRMASGANVLMLQMLHEGIEDGGVNIEELMFRLNESNRDISNRISHTSTTHGLVVKNVGKRGKNTIYLLDGFKEPVDRATRKPKKRDKVNFGDLLPPSTFDPRLNQVFC